MTESNTKKKKSWKRNLFNISASTRGGPISINENETDLNNTYLNRSKSTSSNTSFINSRKLANKSHVLDSNGTATINHQNSSDNLNKSYISSSEKSMSQFSKTARNSSRNGSLNTSSSTSQGLTPEEAALITPRNSSRRLNNNIDGNNSKRKSLFGLTSIFDPFPNSSSSQSTTERKRHPNLEIISNNDLGSGEKVNSIKVSKTDSEPSKNTENSTTRLKKDFQKKISMIPSKSPIVENFVATNIKANRPKSNLSSPISPSFDTFFSRKSSKKSNEISNENKDANPALESHQRLLQNFLNDDSLVMDDSESDSTSIPSNTNTSNQEEIACDGLISKDNSELNGEQDEFHDSHDYSLNLYNNHLETEENHSEKIPDSAISVDNDNKNTSSSDNDDESPATSKTSKFIVDHFKNANSASSSKNKGKSKATLSSLDTQTSNFPLTENSSANTMISSSLKSPSYRDRHREIFNKNSVQQPVSAPVNSNRFTKLSPIGCSTSPASSQYFSPKIASPISSSASPHSVLALKKQNENSRLNNVSNLPSSRSASHFDFSDDDEIHEMAKKDSAKSRQKNGDNERSVSSRSDNSETNTDFDGTITSLLDDMTRSSMSSPNNDGSTISRVNEQTISNSEVSASTMQTLNSVIEASQQINSGSSNGHNINNSQIRSSSAASYNTNRGRRSERSNADDDDNENGHRIIEDHHSRMNLLNPFRRHRFNIRSTRSAQNHQQFQYRLDNYDMMNDNNINNSVAGRSEQDRSNLVAMPTVLQYQSEMLSRLLITASQSTLRNLIGSSYNANDGVRIDNRNRNRDLSTFHSNNGSFEDGSDSSFAEFCHALRHGNLIANELSNSARNESIGNNSESNSMSFFRAFRFPPRIMNEDADGNPIPAPSNSANNNTNNLLQSGISNDDSGDQEEMVPVLILGVRSVMPGEVNQVRQASSSNVSSSTNNSNSGSSETTRNESLNTSGANNASTRSQDEIEDLDENHGRFGRSFFRNRNHRSRFRLENSRNNSRLEEFAQQYSRSRSTYPRGANDRIANASSDAHGTNLSSDSSSNNNNNNGSNSSSRNTSSSSNRNERSWVIFMMGHNFPLDHPVLTAPTLLSENPSYEDLLALQAMLGEVKAPVATAEEVEAGGGLVHLVISGEKFPIDDEDQVYPDIDIVDAADRCLVCLTEFETGEVGRKLKACGHVYHKDCIDRWLTTGRNSCPLCRKKGVPSFKKKSSSPSPSNQDTDTFNTEDSVLNASEINDVSRSTINERHESMGTIDIIGSGTAPLNFPNDLDNHFNL